MPLICMFLSGTPASESCTLLASHRFKRNLSSVSGFLITIFSAMPFSYKFFFMNSIVTSSSLTSIIFLNILKDLLYILCPQVCFKLLCIFLWSFVLSLHIVPLHPEWEEPITFPTVSIKNSGTQSANDVASVRPFLSVTIPSTPFSFFSISLRQHISHRHIQFYLHVPWSESMSFL